MPIELNLKDSLIQADTWKALGDYLWRMGHLTDGAQAWQKAAKFLEAGPKPDADDRDGKEAAARWRAIGDSYVKAGLWSEASACFDRLLKAEVRQSRDNMDDYYNHYSYIHCATLRLQSGNVVGYRKDCKIIHELMEKTEDFKKGWPAAFTWACALDARADLDPGQVLKWSKKVEAVDHGPWQQHIAALAHFRAGRFEQSVSFASNSVVHVQWPGHNSNLPLLALAHHRLGHADEARKWLKQANREWRERSPVAHSITAANVLPVAGAHENAWQVIWQDWLVFEHLLAEANRLD